MPKYATPRKSYKNRFGNFRAGVCPYCGARGATLVHITFGKERYVGVCPSCTAINNFTRPDCLKWMEE